MAEKQSKKEKIANSIISLSPIKHKKFDLNNLIMLTDSLQICKQFTKCIFYIAILCSTVILNSLRAVFIHKIRLAYVECV